MTLQTSAVFTLYQIASALAQKPYQIAFLFTRKTGDFSM